MRKISVQDNHGRCRIRFIHNGSQYSLNLGDYNDSKDRLEAERIALEITQQISGGYFEGIDRWKRKRIDICKDGIIEALSDRANECHHLPPVIIHLENYPGEVRNKREAKRFMESLPVATATKRRYYTAIRKIEELREIFDFNIKTQKGEVKKQIDPFTTDEVEKIKEEFRDNHYRAFVLFLLHTGCRPSEAIGIQWSDIEFDNDRIHFHQSLSRNQENPKERIRKSTKTGKNRFTPLSGELRAVLHSYEPVNDSLVFTTPEGESINDDTFRKSPWTPLLKRCNVRYRSPYNLRHTFISHALKKGVDVVTVAYWVGNSPEVIYKHYAGLVEATDLPNLFG